MKHFNATSDGGWGYKRSWGLSGGVSGGGELQLPAGGVAASVYSTIVIN